MSRQRIYLYPNSEFLYRPGINNYIAMLASCLGRRHTIVNKPSKLGLLDVLLKMHRTDCIYFNWIEDLPHKRFGSFQVPLLFVVVLIAKLFRIRILWFVHNNVSHSRENLFVKRLIVRLMTKTSDVILCHSRELKLQLPQSRVLIFDHPVDAFHPIPQPQSYSYDLLIWGTVSPYKGVAEFIDFVKNDNELQKYRILIAGKFTSEEYYRKACHNKTPNVIIDNRMPDDEELVGLFAKSRLILFTYNSPSVLSSAALCKALPYGVEIIGPNKGSFKELAEKGLIHTYDSFEELSKLIRDILERKLPLQRRDQLEEYVKNTSWGHFCKFLDTVLEGTNKVYGEKDLIADKRLADAS